MISPEATFDSLAICDKLERQDVKYGKPDIFLFAYLSCLLSLYKKRPIADWGYNFSGTTSGAPYSEDIDYSTDHLLASGLASIKDGNLSLTSEGKETLGLLSDLSQNTERLIFLEGACSTLLALPYGIVGNALKYEPELSNAIEMHASKRLLDINGPGLKALYGQFEVLGQALGFDVIELMIPATVWLVALFRESEKEPPSSFALS